MANLEEKIRQIEEEIKKTPYHKATEHHIGKLKARLAKLREEILTGKGKSKGGGVQGFAVKKTGDATVILVGPPSVGKSSLINQLTNAQSKVASYAFTTTAVIPGMLDFKGAKIQILDIPGLITGANLGKGRGKEIISVIRSADLVLIMVDIFTTNKIKDLKNDLYQAGLRLDLNPPNIFFKKTRSGGIKIIQSTRLTNLSETTIKSVFSEFKIKNAEIHLKQDLSFDQLVDFLIGNRRYLSSLVLINKIDLNKYFYYKKDSEVIYLSAQKGLYLDNLKEAIWNKLNLIRIYLKKRDGQADFSQPFILRKGQSLKDLINKISICTKGSFKRAKIYGPGAKFPGQLVSFNFLPSDQTIVSFL